LAQKSRMQIGVTEQQIKNSHKQRSRDNPVFIFGMVGKTCSAQCWARRKTSCRSTKRHRLTGVKYCKEKSTKIQFFVSFSKNRSMEQFQSFEMNTASFREFIESRWDKCNTFRNPEAAYMIRVLDYFCWGCDDWRPMDDTSQLIFRN